MFFFKRIIKTLHVSVTTVWPSTGVRLLCLVPLLHLRFIYEFNVFGSVHLCKVQWSNKLMQLLIVFISYPIIYSTFFELHPLNIRSFLYLYIPKKNLIIRIFCISRWLAVPINPVIWSSTILGEKSLPLSLGVPQIPHALAWNCSRAFEVGSRRLRSFYLAIQLFGY
jgi:hypothetical protein